MTLRQISAVCASRFSQPGFFLLVILLTAANLRAPITAVGPVLENIRSAFGLSAAAAGFFNFIPLMMFAALAPVAAVLGNRYGLERSLWVALLLTTLGSLVRWLPDEAALWTGTLCSAPGSLLLTCCCRR